MFLLSFVVSLFMVCVILRKREIPRNVIFYSVFLNLICILCGAKLYTMLASGLSVDLLRAGFSSLGGAIGLFLGTYIFGKIYTQNTEDFWMAYITVLPLMYGISKLGCYSAGCCHGIAYEGPLAVSYDNAVIHGGPYFPIQLLESVCYLLIFAFGFWMLLKRKENETECVVLLCAVTKFSLEYLRQEHVGVVLSVNQLVCIGFFCWSVYRFLRIRLDRRKGI